MKSMSHSKMPAMSIVVRSEMPASVPASNSELEISPCAPVVRMSTSRSIVLAANPDSCRAIDSSLMSSSSRRSDSTWPSRCAISSRSPGFNSLRAPLASGSATIAARSVRLRPLRRNRTSSVSPRLTSRSRMMPGELDRFDRFGRRRRVDGRFAGDLEDNGGSGSVLSGLGRGSIDASVGRTGIGWRGVPSSTRTVTTSGRRKA